MSSHPHLPPGDLPQEPPSLLQDSSRARLTPKKRSAQYLARSDDAGTHRSAVTKPSPGRRDAAAAIIRHIRKQDHAPTHFTEAEFMAPLTSPALWLELCGNLSKNKSVKTKFRRILKDDDFEPHGLGVYYLGLNAKGSDHYYLEFCEPTERESRGASAVLRQSGAQARAPGRARKSPTRKLMISATGSVAMDF